MGTVLGRALGRVAPDAPPPPRREGEPVCAARAETRVETSWERCPCELKRRSARWCTHTTAHRHTHTLVSSCSTYPCKMYIYMYARAPQCHTPLAPGHPGRHVTHDTRPTRHAREAPPEKCWTNVCAGSLLYPLAGSARLRGWEPGPRLPTRETERLRPQCTKISPRFSSID